jgi:ketosteroid isomerase-like protein
MTNRRLALAVLTAAALTAAPACTTSVRPSPVPSPDAAAIREARLEQNAALARHDISAAAVYWTENITVRAGLGAALSGRENYAAAFAAESSILYERIPDSIIVSARWPLAFEEGHWSGRRVGAPASAPPLASGRYAAQWVRRDRQWLIQSEVYVAIECAGAGCNWPASIR